jgi:hypothetical protein
MIHWNDNEIVTPPSHHTGHRVGTIAAAPLIAPQVPPSAMLTQSEVDALWQGNTANWTGLVRQVEAAVHLKLYQSTL